jgi:hypothetical protein
LTCQQADHGAAGRVGDRLEYIPSCLHMGRFVYKTVWLCKFIYNHLIMQIFYLNVWDKTG